MATSAKTLTLRELAALVSRLDGQRISPRRLRYLLIDGGLGTDTRRRPCGQTRLYGELDAAFAVLAIRLRRDGASTWVTRVVLTYLRNDLVRAWRTAAPLAVAIRGIHGSLEPALKGRPAWAAAWVPLREIWRGLTTDIQHAADRAEVWMWRPIAVRLVPRNTA